MNTFTSDMTQDQKIRRAAQLNRIVNERIAALMATMTAEIEEFNDLKRSLTQDCLELGETLIGSNGDKVVFVSEQRQARWDDSALQGLAIVHPKILQFRNETVVKPQARFVWQK